MTDYSQMQRDEAQVREGFWHKARKTLGQVPFTDQAVAAFYCATDSATPLRIRGVLFINLPGQLARARKLIREGAVTTAEERARLFEVLV